MREPSELGNDIPMLARMVSGAPQSLGNEIRASAVCELFEQCYGTVLHGNRLRMLHGHVEKQALQRQQRVMQICSDSVDRQIERFGILGERCGSAPVHIARKLVQQEDERETPAWSIRPALQARLSRGRHCRCEAIAYSRIEAAIRAEPASHEGIDRGRIRCRLAKPELENFFGRPRHAQSRRGLAPTIRPDDGDAKPAAGHRVPAARPACHTIGPIVGVQLPFWGRALAATAVLFYGCSAEDPATVIEQLIQETEVAVESRDTGHFRGLIADSYIDARGNDRERLINLIRGYFLANQSIDVLSRIETVELRGEDAAEIVVLAGLLARRPGAGLLEGFDGRLYRLELELVENDGDWQIIGASWERSLEAFRGD